MFIMPPRICNSFSHEVFVHHHERKRYKIMDICQKRLLELVVECEIYIGHSKYCPGWWRVEGLAERHILAFIISEMVDVK